jgi:hypothetical protein
MEKFEDFAGIDYSQKAERDRLFADIVDHVLGEMALPPEPRT